MDAGVCTPWADIGDVCAPCNSYDFDTDALADWLLVASDMLYDLTGRRWPGLCTRLVRPCHTSLCACGPTDRCGCSGTLAYDLGPGAAAVSVEAVTIDGADLAPERYELREGRWLQYLPTSDSDPFRWPRHQRLGRATTEVDTWAIAYTQGAEPPLGGAKAAAQLGCQLALSCSADGEARAACQLPKATTNISRQGVTIARQNPAALYPGGQTGMASVDLWVSTVNTGAKRRPASVFVPGQRPRHRVVG